MRWAIVPLCVALCCCRPGAVEQPETIYREAQLDLQRGDFKAAEQRAAYGHTRSKGSKDWDAAFTILDAELFTRQYDFQQSLKKLAQVKEPGLRTDLRVRLRMLHGQSVCSLAGGDDRFQTSTTDLDEAARQANSIPSPELLAEVELRRGTCLIYQQKPEEAERVFQQTMDIVRQNHLDYLQANTLGNLGYLRIQDGRYDQAIDYFRESMAIARAHQYTALVVKGLGNLGLCYSRLGDYDNATLILKQAEDVAPLQEYRGDMRTLLQNIGNLFYLRGDLTSAQKYYERSLGFARELKQSRATAQLLSNLGIVALERGDLAQAERFNQQALQLKQELHDPAAEQHSRLTEANIAAARDRYAEAQTLFGRIVDSPDASSEVKWEAHAGLANLLVKRKWNKEADSEYREAIRIIEDTRSNLRQDESKITFLSSMMRLYNSYVAFLVTTNRAADALEVADRSRARILWERTGKQGQSLPLIKATRFPAIARQLNAVVLSYWLTPTQSYVWAVSPTGIQVFPLPPDKEIEKAVDVHQRLILRPRDLLHEDNGQASVLYNMLVRPARAAVNGASKVLIIADGCLHRVNFETLVIDAPIRHYWLEDITVGNAPSLGLLSLNSASRPAVSRQAILLIGDPDSPDADFPKLPNAAREIRQIQKLFSDGHEKTYVRGDATPAAYLAAKPEDYALIHFAAHATANPLRPLDSAVVLSRQGDSFKLYARDVMKLPLQAELVTISACRSAGARTYSGEGLVGLAWAFLNAGAHNVVAGLWNVEDASTSQLMEQMYRELLMGRDPAESLRTAKLALIRSPGAYRRPFFWAPFVTYQR